MAVTFSACRDDFDAPGAESNAISFSIGSDAAVSRAAVDSTATTFVSIRQKYFNEIIDGDTLAFTLTESPNTDLPFTDEQPASRTKPLDNTENPITNFDVACYAHEGTATPKFYFKGTYQPTGNQASTDYYWPANGTPLSFYASAIYYPEASVTVNHEYTLNAETNLYEGNIDYQYLPSVAEGKTWHAAYRMPDVVAAITPNIVKPSNGVAPLQFHHALSAVVFKVTNAVEDINIVDIYIDNVYSTGTCKYSNIAGSNDINFAWTPNADSKANFVQSFHKQISPDDFDSGDVELNDFMEDQSSVEGKFGAGSTTFMLIPQTLPDDAQLRIVISRPVYQDRTDEGNKRRYTITKNLKSLIGDLKPDTKNTFSLGLNTYEMDVDVTDEVSGAVKSNVRIQNTGLAAGYVRAAICGWWKNDKDMIAAGWSDDIYSCQGKQTKYGNMVWDANWKDNWVLCDTDGFYYYKKLLPAGAFTDVPLFNSYTITNVPSIPGASLELDIAVQIVHKDFVSGAKDGAGFGWCYTSY